MKTKSTLMVSRTALATAAVVAMMLIGSTFAQAPAKPKTAGETFKNVTTTSLKNLTVDDFLGTMGVISADLGLDCADCHPGAGSDKVDWVVDTPQKVTARKMIDMVAAINKNNFN